MKANENPLLTLLLIHRSIHLSADASRQGRDPVRPAGRQHHVSGSDVEGCSDDAERSGVDTGLDHRRGQAARTGDRPNENDTGEHVSNQE